MKVVAMIPARLQASRFPEKLLQDLGGKPVIVHTYLAAKNSGLFENVIVVTDHISIAQVIENIGGKVFISQMEHQSGSDRIAEAAQHIDADIIVNVQGDEPFINTQALSSVIDILKNDTLYQIDLASLMQPIDNESDIQNPNQVKVVVNRYGDAMYFSRSVIPYNRDKLPTSYYKHIGIYAFRKHALLAFYKMKPSELEKTEKLEQLRFLENGYRIRMALTYSSTIGIDTPEDLEKARLILKG